MTNPTKLRIWHVGNWCIHIGQKYVESPFEAPSKDVEVLNYAQPFIDALQTMPGTEVISQPSWELYHMAPDAFDERLRWATTIVFADVETKCLMLHPDFFQRAKWGDKSLVFPDRFDLLRDWVSRGGHFHMNGGWLSFAGELGKGGWGRSRFHNALPVECLQHDDLIESTAGYSVRCVGPEHPSMRGIDWSTVPALLGFNETKLRQGSDCIIEIENQGEWHPLLAERRLDSGRVTCWMTGASPHWGINFVKWQYYNQFWSQLFSL
ncbi:MAG TPA: glutamine amidotransferase [Pyrinomonadaceae bacterium]|nr:glutamine amidotransferase [Pyrinomonadaceae bacterium]